MIKQVLYSLSMNIGGRIVQRLEALQWERKDLLARVPDLTAQALSNLIRRDSVRSEWDELIAEALGVSVMWLVYGKNEARDQANESAPPTYSTPLTEDELFVAHAYRAAKQEAKVAMMFIARAIFPDENALNKRTGTD